MAVRIRLKRFGAKNSDKWRVVVADVRMPRDGRFIEEIGYYDAVPREEKIVIEKERYDYWVSQGAQPSVTVQNLFKRAQKKASAK